MRIPFETAVAVWLAVAAALAGCAESAGSGKGGTGGSGGSGGCGGGGAGGTCEATGGGGACNEPCIEDPGWDVTVGDECFCPDRECGSESCDGGWRGVCTDGNWHFSHWDGSDDPTCGP